MLTRISPVVTIPLLTALGALLLASILAAPARPAMARAASQTPTALTLDVEIDGNSAVSVGFIDSCTGVSLGEEFPVDVLVQKVKDLVAWEVYLQYDRTRLEVVGIDVGDDPQDPLFLGVSSNSSVIDVSDPVPSRSGLYRLAAADIAIPAAPERGSGVLARVTLKARAAGVAAIAIPHLDYNDDSTYDLGPRLITLRGQEIGDRDGDGFLDSPGNSGHVAIGSSCADLTESSPGPGIEGGDTQPPDSGETPIGADQPLSDSSEDTPSRDDASDDGSDAEETPKEAEGASAEGVGSQPDGASGGERNQRGDGNGGFDLWMILPVAGLGLLGLLFGLFALRRGGIGL